MSLATHDEAGSRCITTATTASVRAAVVSNVVLIQARPALLWATIGTAPASPCRVPRQNEKIRQAEEPLNNVDGKV
ncbi:MAG: hypothetical protein D3908_03060 [Candidatus Electrothrix sp. AUS4]|nr:hypothetical protein [Candidatus Electrothrix sp. AUS4]